jgi:hypothetical protein
MTQAPAKIKVINGANAGKELVLTKAVTTVGSPERRLLQLQGKRTDILSAMSKAKNFRK